MNEDIIVLVIIVVVVVVFLMMSQKPAPPATATSTSTHSITGLDGIISSVNPGILAGIGGATTLL